MTHGHANLHGHTKRGALLLGAGGLLLGLAIVAWLPTSRLTAAVGGGFVILFAIKHLALLMTFGSPAAAILSQLRHRVGHRWRGASRPAAGAEAGRAAVAVPVPDGYFRTGEAEPHEGLIRVVHDVERLPADPSRQALLDVDVDKRLTLIALSDVDADTMREGLRERFARRGFGDRERVDRFLAALTGRIARGQSVIISYDAAAKITRLAVEGRTATTGEGLDFMRATWSLWFGESVPSSLADSLRSEVR